MDTGGKKEQICFLGAMVPTLLITKLLQRMGLENKLLLCIFIVIVLVIFAVIIDSFLTDAYGNSASTDAENENAPEVVSAEVVSHLGASFSSNPLEMHKQRIREAIERELPVRLKRLSITAVYEHVEEEIRIMKETGEWTPSLEREITAWAKNWIEELKVNSHISSIGEQERRISS